MHEESKPTPFSRPDVTKRVLLPSGRVAEFIQAKGIHQRKAIAAAGKNPSQGTLMFALIAQILLLDGKAIPWEAIDNMDLRDVNVLEKEAAGPLGTEIQPEISESFPDEFSVN